MNRWRVRKAQCQTCIENARLYDDANNVGDNLGYGADGKLVWVVYRDGGEFGCRPTHDEAVKYAHRKAEALG
jgi:hypothetical protein